MIIKLDWSVVVDGDIMNNQLGIVRCTTTITGLTSLGVSIDSSWKTPFIQQYTGVIYS